ncbi:hypothetical protein AMEX_G13698 [Astyanax mexicanus]|uniref:Sorting nexin C-terminal domain-containing protein n=1 Tax=Astyanax mexicanus TaxID=7994 RepID=A0A8T2LKL9_ASTMX|nr:hypothetical protein AMEX_G13698 [Astyanax mexicanus]
MPNMRSLWLVLLAVAAVLVWYLSDFGLFLVQAGIGLLCFLLSFTTARCSAERSTQTSSSSEEPAVESSETDHVDGRDVPDTAVQTVQKPTKRSEYTNVQRSLNQLFKCAYAHLVLPWYTVPEPVDSQPLHAALHTEFNLIVDQIIIKAKKFDLSATSVGCIHIFTQHLRCAKQPTRSPLFSSKSQEMNAYREFSKALILSLFPQHLWEPVVYRCALQEILALKVPALVTLLSDPDNLNRLVVCQLDRVTSENPAEEVQDTDKENTNSSSGSQNAEVSQQEVEEIPSEENKTKKSGNKVKKKFSKLFDSLNPKKGRKKKQIELRQQALLSRRPAVIELETDGPSSCDNSSYDSEDSDVESCTGSLREDMMEFKLSFEMWRAGKWTVTVTNVEIEDEKLCFTVHLEENNNKENLHWDVKKTKSEIVEFYHCCKDLPHLPSIVTIEENTETELNEQLQEELRDTFENFLQALVADTELGPTQLVFEFLCPLRRLLKTEEHEGGVWVLLGGLASFLTPGHEDDEVCPLEGEEKPDDLVDTCSLSEATPPHDESSPLKAACTDSCNTVHKESEEELLVTDSESSPSYDQTDDSTSEKDQTDYADYLFQASHRRISSRSESVDENLAHFAARTTVLPKKQPTVFCSFDSDDAGHYETDSISDLYISENVSKRDSLSRKKSPGSHKIKGKEKGHHAKDEPRNESKCELKNGPQLRKKASNMPNMGQPDVDKVIFDLLKEISGNSRILKFVKTFLTPFMSLIKKKLNTFLKKLNPSEVQTAEYIDKLRELIWPEGASQELPRCAEEMNETREKAMHLLSSKLSGYPIFSKADVEAMFKILQDAEENKKLVYMLLSYILEQFLNGEAAFKGIPKDTF